jgi:hypothetical protein
MQATASISSDSYSDSLEASSIYEARAYAEQMKHSLEYDESDGSCMKGMVVALGIEVFAATVICFVWQALHFAR